jgi:hypothetical protein
MGVVLAEVMVVPVEEVVVVVVVDIVYKILLVLLQETHIQSSLAP